MASYPKQLNPGAFLPTTSVFDVSVIYSTDVNSPEFKELIVRLQQAVNNIAINVNLRDAGYYPLTEFINGQLFFPVTTGSSQSGQTPQYRQDYRIVINFGALPNNATKSVPHGLDINNGTINLPYTFTRIYGTATDYVNNVYVPISYSSTTGNNIELYADKTNVVIKTNSDWSSFTTTLVILEYLKN